VQEKKRRGAGRRSLFIFTFILYFTFGTPCFHFSIPSVLKSVGPIRLIHQFFYLLVLRFYTRTKLAKKPRHIWLVQQLCYFPPLFQYAHQFHYNTWVIQLVQLLLSTTSDFISAVPSLKSMGRLPSPTVLIFLTRFILYPPLSPIRLGQLLLKGMILVT